MSSNKHMTVAMIVAPILAIISYFATDYIVSEDPVVAAKGDTYALLPRSNCRYQSGECAMRNGDVEIVFRLSMVNDTYVLEAQANRPLTGVKAALTSQGQSSDAMPSDLRALDDSGQHWAWTLPAKPSPQSELRVAALADGIQFYASTQTTFFEDDSTELRTQW